MSPSTPSLIPAPTGCKCALCDRDAEFVMGRKPICVMHSRIEQMRDSARSFGKAVPSVAALEAMFERNPDLICPDCGKEMVWARAVGPAKRVVTLQHYRDGRFGLVCLTCNVRHRAMPGDSYQEHGPLMKFCPGCKRAKFRTAFGSIHTEDKPGVNTRCKSCRKAAFDAAKVALEETKEQSDGN